MDDYGEKSFQIALFTEQSNIYKLCFPKLKTLHHCNFLRIKPKTDAVIHLQLTFTCLKSIIETLEKGMNYVQN